MQTRSPLGQSIDPTPGVTAEIQRFLQDSGLTFCELVTLARGAGGSNDTLYQRLTMLGLNADRVDLAALNRLALHSADDVAHYAQPAAWPSHS